MAPRIAVLTCLLLLFSTASAGAEGGTSKPDFARPGWYLGAGFSFGFDSFSGIKEIEAAIGENVTVGDAFGVNGRVGYRILPRLAVETEFEWFSAFNIQNEAANKVDVTIEDYTLTVNAKGYLMTGRVQPFGLIGLGGMLANTTDRVHDREVDSGGFVARFGGGVDYYLDESWILTIDASYLITTGSVSNTDRTSLGVGFQYRF
jgi:opacity protein-like surface antigen